MEVERGRGLLLETFTILLLRIVTVAIHSPTLNYTPGSLSELELSYFATDSSQSVCLGLEPLCDF
jgi:hypothetical protein